MMTAGKWFAAGMVASLVWTVGGAATFATNVIGFVAEDLRVEPQMLGNK